MKSSILFLFFSMFIFSTINCYTIEPVNILENTLDILTLTNSWNFFLLRNSNNPNASNKMLIEIMFSHPSKYSITLNNYKNEPIIMDDNKKFTPNYSRNQTNLIDSEENTVGKSRLILNISKTSEGVMNDIILYIKRNDYFGRGDEDKVMIRYLSNATSEKFYLSNTTINLEKDKKVLNVTFGGISSNIIKNFLYLAANYTIDIFEKETLEKNLENVYSYALYDDKRISLYHRELRKQPDIANNKFIRIDNFTTKSKKELLLLIKVKVFNSTNILQYQAVTFKISKDSGGKDTDEVDTEKNIKENKPTLILILAFYSGAVLLTFIAVFIYLTIKNKKNEKNNKNAEDYDYKNIGEIKTLSEDD